MLTKREKMTSYVGENIPALISFQAKILLVGFRGPATPKFDLKFGRRIGKRS
jgi:hypothetical protein